MIRIFHLPAGLAALVLALGLVWPGSVRANETLPSFNLPSVITPGDVDGLSVDFDDAFDSIESPYLSDTIKMQYQISLLDKLIERQSKLEQIATSYDALGIPFTPPPPPRGICVQLPANAPCLKAYPDLYKGLIAERKTHYDDMKKKIEAEAEAAARRMGLPVQSASAANDPAAAARARKEEAERKAKEEAAERKDRYRWTDVTCLTGSCYGVLIKPKEDGYRVTVRPGTRLPDGTLVQQISTSGIRISLKGDVIDVRPAPGEGANTAASGANAAAPAIQENNVGDAMRAADAERARRTPSPDFGPTPTSSQQLTSSIVANAQNGANTTSTDAPASAAPSGATSGGQTVSQPTLGPSGLF
ncbi:MAG: hypothetical protein H6866_05375 [Rhodospirillales bacterium]|nr:MAG: hypothetical protein H6866_05375 [Rhodospirillales bacterium]